MASKSIAPSKCSPRETSREQPLKIQITPYDEATEHPKLVKKDNQENDQPNRRISKSAGEQVMRALPC